MTACWYDVDYFIGWLAKIRLSDPNELTILMDEEAYAAHCANAEDH